MNAPAPATFHELAELRDRVHVFQDRAHAGDTLARMLAHYRDSDSWVLGIPAGGVPVAAQIARRLDLPLDTVVVSKITLPWNSESGFGAVAFDGTVRLNETLLPRLGLSQQDIDQCIERTKAKVRRRVQMLYGEHPPVFAGRSLIVVDDGLASGFTLEVAVDALMRRGAARITVAVPTAHWQAAQRLAARVHELYCANVRGGWSFAVADAYRHWSDVDERAVALMLQDLTQPCTARTPAQTDGDT
jgi:putative phosphoribosyl transferase